MTAIAKSEPFQCRHLLLDGGRYARRFGKCRLPSSRRTASPRAATDGFSASQDVAADPSVMDHISCPPGSRDGASANEPSSHVTTESATAPATADDAESPHRSSKPPKLRIKIRSPKREQHEAKDPTNGVQDSSSTPSPSPHHVTGSGCAPNALIIMPPRGYGVGIARGGR